jgi:N-ethylmaleimide reductase
LAAPGNHFTRTFESVPFETPRALTEAEITGIVGDFAQAARNAREAGFDGVEVHGANGYLIDQFLRDGTNKRTDGYGGPIANRTRFLTEVVDAVTAAVGADRVGVRLSPWGTFNGMADSDTNALHADAPDASSRFKPKFGGVLIAAGGFTGETAARAIASGEADAVAFGRLFIGNPDLPERLRTGAPLNRYDRSTFYGGDEHGYTDYPALQQQAAE